MPTQLLLFVPPALPSHPQLPPETWQDVSEVSMEVGLPLAYAEKDLLKTLPDPDGARLWDVLWTTHYYLKVLHENCARFTLTWGGKDYRFIAIHLKPAGILVRLDSVQPITNT